MTREEAERWVREPCPGGGEHIRRLVPDARKRDCLACLLDALTASTTPLTPEDQAAIRAAALPGATREQIWDGACAAQRAVPGAAPHYPWPASPAQGEAGLRAEVQCVLDDVIEATQTYTRNGGQNGAAMVTDQIASWLTLALAGRYLAAHKPAPPSPAPEPRPEDVEKAARFTMSLPCERCGGVGCFACASAAHPAEKERTCATCGARTGCRWSIYPGPVGCSDWRPRTPGGGDPAQPAPSAVAEAIRWIEETQDEDDEGAQEVLRLLRGWKEGTHG